jgi:hypothetical protein
MLNIINQQGDASQNHNKLSPHSVRIAIFKKIDNNSVGEDAEKREYLYIVEGNINLYSHYRKPYRVPQKMVLPYDPAIPWLGIYIKKKLYQYVEETSILPCSLQHNSQ